MSSGSFAKQVAIITGAGQGIGFEIARQLAIQGASVLLNDVDETKAKLAAEKIGKEGTCHPMGGDASDIQFIKNMVNEATNRFGKLTIAIANAGIKGMKPALLAETLLKKYKIYTVAIDGANVHGCRITPNLFILPQDLDVLVKAFTELAAA